MYVLWPKTTEEFLKETQNSYEALKDRAIRQLGSG